MKLLLISLALLVSTNLFACTCILANVKERVHNYDIIIKAEVLSVKKHTDKIDEDIDTTIAIIQPQSLFGYKTTLLVKAYYKGKQIQDTMYIAPVNDNCELNLKEGSTYLVLGQYDNGEIQTSICSGSRLFKNNPDLRYLRRKRKFKPKTDLLHGN